MTVVVHKRPRSDLFALYISFKKLLVTTSKAPVTTSKALVPSSFLFLVVRKHLENFCPLVEIDTEPLTSLDVLLRSF